MKNKSTSNKILLYLLAAIISIVVGRKALLNNDANNEQSNYLQDEQKETLGQIEDVLNAIDNVHNLSIDELTNEDIVVEYLKEHHRLPDCYITKKEARELGWIPSEGNLCDVLPGRAIGGDYFGNREGKLPKKPGRKYYEADLNYNCGRRNADRVVYSNDQLIFVTKDHYKTFIEK